MERHQRKRPPRYMEEPSIRSEIEVSSILASLHGSWRTMLTRNQLAKVVKIARHVDPYVREEKE
jgi:hypothetical protein